MAVYTVLENGIAVNHIEAESKEIAELVTGKTCVYGAGVFGYRCLENGSFVPDCAFPSWKWNAELGIWEAPKKKPKTGDYGWDEGSLSWVAIQPVEPIDPAQYAGSSAE